MSLYGARVEYALHTLVNLSRVPDGVLPSARDLADFQKLPVAFTRKILSQLERAGIVAGTEGAGGGWRLGRHASEITVLDVVDATQESQPLFECREVRARCALWDDGEPPGPAVTGVCSIHAVMLGAEAAMRGELSKHTLADIGATVARKSSRDALRTTAAWFTERTTQRRSTS